MATCGLNPALSILRLVLPWSTTSPRMFTFIWKSQTNGQRSRSLQQPQLFENFPPLLHTKFSPRSSGLEHEKRATCVSLSHSTDISSTWKPYHGRSKDKILVHHALLFGQADLLLKRKSQQFANQNHNWNGNQL